MPWRPSRFRTAGMSNTPPPWPWHLRAIPLESEALANDLEKRFPEDTFVRFTYLPVLRALSALHRGNPTEGLEQLQIALPYELAANGLDVNFYLGGLHSAYVRGEAFVAAHQYAEAAAEFQKILDHRGVVGADPIGALAHLQLGRTFAFAGDTVKARLRTRIFSHFGKTPTPTSRFCSKPRRNTPGSCERNERRASRDHLKQIVWIFPSAGHGVRRRRLGALPN